MTTRRDEPAAGTDASASGGAEVPSGGGEEASVSDRAGAPSSGVPWNSPVVRVVLLSTLLAPLGVPLVSPALPVVGTPSA
ncbi:MAG: hypothetical protein ABEJ28_06770 [Salinigranum sp.]